MQCDYFDAHRCRSCSLMGTTYADQLAAKLERSALALGHVAPELEWSSPFSSQPQGFRNKAKLVVGGMRGQPTVGILDRDGRGVDLRDCGLYEPGLDTVVRRVPALITELGLVPYDVARRTGELKHVLLTHSPAGELMMRFVLRSPGQLGRIRRHLRDLLDSVPQLRVVSVNLQPAHAAVLEGADETVLTEQVELPMQVNDVRLRLRTRSFFQTNTAVAAGLYRQAREWIDECDPASLVDLYCGVGGFALHTSVRPDGSPRSVLGVEVSGEAVDSARAAAAEMGVDARFEVGDASLHLLQGRPPDLVVVNPPRRGIGPELAHRLDRSSVPHVLYSSCNVDSLAYDLQQMPSLVPTRGRLFDMFPQTGHMELLTLLARR